MTRRRSAAAIMQPRRARAVLAALALAAIAQPGCIVTADLAGKTCDAQHSCDGALFCVDGVCVVDPPPDASRLQDAGHGALGDGGDDDDEDAGFAADAGTGDAGSVDGGRTDGGLDDAGALDAGAIDAGPLGDGGADDGGVEDGGPLDAGAGDAGAPDSGAIEDAGPPVMCGDGRIDGAEACDDENLIDGDGCSAGCALEQDAGTTCFGAPSVCAPTSTVTFLCQQADAGCATRVPQAPVNGSHYFVRAGTYEHPTFIDIHDKVVVIVGEPGTVLVGTSNTSLIFVDGNMTTQRLRLQGLTLRATGQTVPLDVKQAANVVVEDCVIGPSGAVGVRHAEQAKLTMRRSIVTGNLGGGLSLQGDTAHIESTFVVDNGLVGAFGGVHLQGPGPKRLILVTVAGNDANGLTGAGGVSCGDVDDQVDLVGSIVWGNGGATQLHERCLASISYVEGSAVDPQFVDPSDGDYHLAPSSPLISAIGEATLDDALRAAEVDGGTDALEPFDVDREPRPEDGAYEPGADEVAP